MRSLDSRYVVALRPRAARRDSRSVGEETVVACPQKLSTGLPSGQTLSNRQAAEQLGMDIATCLDCPEPHFYLACLRCEAATPAVPAIMSWAVAWLWAGAHHRAHLAKQAAAEARAGRGESQ